MLLALKIALGVHRTTSSLPFADMVKCFVRIFNPDKNYEFSNEHILSSSMNCAYLGNKLKGIVYGSVNGDKFTLNKVWT